jgi:endoplasmic reticulum-Golgi intermediate compartment protein 3
MDPGLRRRGQNTAGGGMMEVEEKPVEKMTKMVKKFDMYAKVKDEYKVKATPSTSGTYLNMIAWSLIAILTLSELWTYARGTSTKEHMLVDTSLGQKLRINMNITFPALSCAEIHVDAMDVAGDYHPYMEQDMTKQRLKSDGTPIGKKVDEQANVYENKGFELHPDYCGSCYGAETEEEKCCNTCESVRGRERDMTCNLCVYFYIII